MTVGSAVTTLAFLVAGLIFYFSSRERGMATEGMGYLALIGAAGGVLTARMVQLLGESAPAAVLLDPRVGGRTILGGVIGGWVAVEICKRYLGIRRSTGDAFALALAAGEAIGRLGCHLNTCCYGRPTQGWPAVYQEGAWRYPTQLYSAAVAALLFLLLWRLRSRLPREGDLFTVYLLAWSVSRFVMEFWRDNPPWWNGLTLAQVACLALFGFALVRGNLGRFGRTDPNGTEL